MNTFPEHIRNRDEWWLNFIADKGSYDRSSQEQRIWQLSPSEKEGDNFISEYELKTSNSSINMVKQKVVAMVCWHAES